MLSWLSNIPPVLQTILLLTASNVFMTFAWYGHLKKTHDSPPQGSLPYDSLPPLYLAVLASWGIAFFEYVLQVPANRIGQEGAKLSGAQLKIMQEIITLSVFVPFSLLYMRQPLRLDFLWAGLCLCGAVFFIFRQGTATAGH